MALAAIKPRMVVGAILNDIGPEVATEGLARIAAYAGTPVETPTWSEAARYVKTHNAVAFPHYSDADWDAFARRVFREGAEGAPVLDYDPDISVPIKAAGPKALTPNLWPWFRRLTRKRPVLALRGGTSDLLSPAIAAKMQKAAPKMILSEVPGVGHAPMLDEPEAKAAIFEFLSEVP
jgi:pimeloyl-ACP methyl ester carboxylesterase